MADELVAGVPVITPAPDMDKPAGRDGLTVALLSVKVLVGVRVVIAVPTV